MSDSTIERLVEDYCAAWNAPDPAASHALLARCWAEGGAYTDPTVHVVGAGELVAHIFRVQARRPGSRIVMTSGIDAHHDTLRFNWKRINPDRSIVVEGLDVATLDDGRIARMIGFFGPLL
ncbi:MAG: nuclear transport factor 2 family protein [Reyranellaceae bacterium]